MKKAILLAALSVVVLSCNKTNKTEQTVIESEKQSEEVVDTAVTPQKATNFDIKNIPFSEADLGVFPFFTLPEGLRTIQPLQKKFDVCFFPINGVMTPFEGRLYKANITPEQGEEFSQRYFEKSLDDYLLAIGAVKIFDGEITKEEYDRYNKEDHNKGDQGDMGYAGQRIKFYVIRSKEQGNIYVQFTAHSAGGSLNILQEEAFKQTIAKISADDIQRDLNDKGKSILYIQFDLDKSDITADGDEAVRQITTVLKRDPNLKIAIEGHTDNTGNAAHNKDLSKNRANAVMQSLIAQGIDKTRLSAKGFGADKPLVANDSEDNKAKNRRVELVKIK